MVTTQDGVVYSWGLNDYGQLGDGTTINKYIPMLIISSVMLAKTIVKTVSGVHNSLALTSDNILFSWGGIYSDSKHDWLLSGDGTSTLRKTPIQITLAGSKLVQDIAATSRVITIVCTDGTIYYVSDNSDRVAVCYLIILLITSSLPWEELFGMHPLNIHCLLR